MVIFIFEINVCEKFLNFLELNFFKYLIKLFFYCDLFVFCCDFGLLIIIKFLFLFVNLLLDFCIVVNF